jgi:hypothetical protein
MPRIGFVVFHKFQMIGFAAVSVFELASMRASRSALSVILPGVILDLSSRVRDEDGGRQLRRRFSLGEMRYA